MNVKTEFFHLKDDSQLFEKFISPATLHREIIVSSRFNDSFILRG